jgi:hypothetical protein
MCAEKSLTPTKSGKENTMSNDNNDILVPVDEGDTPASAAEGKKEPVSRAIEPEEGVETLRAKLEQERNSRLDAERRAQAAAQAAASARTEVADSNLALVTNAIDTLKQNESVLKKSYAEAMSAGDYDRAAEVQAAMSTNSAKLLQLEQGKTALENAPKTQQTPAAAPADPVEALASQLSPRSAAWVRANPQFARDSRLYAKMIAAHNLAVADGLSADTDEYFEAVEDTLKMRREAPVSRDSDPMSDAAKPVARRSAPAVAPVSRNNTPGARPNVVRLTSAEREMAQMMGMSDQEYARNKLALQREGKLN